MESQKIRDAKEEIEKWIKEEDKIAMETPYPWKTKINLMKKLFEKS